MTINDFYPEAPYDFGFFAPITPGTSWYESRRVFFDLPLPSSTYRPDGHLILKVVLKKPHAQPGFTVGLFDLVQLLGTGEGITDDPPTDSAQGADFDYSGGVTTTDLEAFLTAWLYQQPKADFNNDGVVDQADLDAFLLKYSH